MKNILSKIAERFKSFNRDNWIVITATFLIFVLLLYFCIGMSISLSRGLTLFGDENYHENQMETAGPTGSDITVIVLFWILLVLVLALLIYLLFFKKIENKDAVKKEIVDGRTFVIKEEEKKDDGRDSENSEE